ncbi:hypothetical protein [Streptomyces sp. NPDC007905]|uniref:hypothetical protein n=1 Tax=Streptomyces sp. NPDC007905 TaxID=3364788 RepID=UPI0036EB3A10
MRYLNGTGRLALFTGTETMTARTVDVDARDEATGLPLVVDPQRGPRGRSRTTRTSPTWSEPTR